MVPEKQNLCPGSRALFFSCLALPSEAGVRMRGDDGTAPVLVLGVLTG